MTFLLDMTIHHLPSPITIVVPVVTFEEIAIEITLQAPTMLKA